jgi:hypothetical protein
MIMFTGIRTIPPLSTTSGQSDLLYSFRIVTSDSPHVCLARCSIGKQRALPPYLGMSAFLIVPLFRADYYPRSASESFLEHVQPLYDKYCKDGSTLFAMGETG